MDSQLNQTIIEKATIKSVAIYKAITMLPPPSFEDKFKKEILCQQNENTQNQNSEQCLNKPEQKTEPLPNDTTNETKTVNEQESCRSITKIKSGIYKIINKVDGKYYVGSSQNIIERWKKHKNGLKKNSHPNKHLQNAYNKHGVNSFEYMVVEYIMDINELLRVEQIYLDECKKNPNRNYMISYDAIASMRGINHSNETRKKISIALTGKKASYETRSKLKIAQQNRNLKGDKNPWYGKGHLQLGRSNPAYDHTIYHWFNKYTNDTEVCHRCVLIKKYKLSESHIHRVIKGKRKSHKGWTLVGLVTDQPAV